MTKTKKKDDDEKFTIVDASLDDSSWARQQVKWITGLEHHCELAAGFGEQAQLKDWCLENCEGKVAYVDYGYTCDDGPDIYFYVEEDAAAFKLRWT